MLICSLRTWRIRGSWNWLANYGLASGGLASCEPLSAAASITAAASA
jgi:hypothetical protein